MPGITIDDTARFVSTISFELASGDVPELSREVQRAVEERAPKEKGFLGCVVMLNKEKPHLLVVSIWESGGAWSEAQYDQEIGQVVTEMVEAAKSYEIQTYETVTVVRA